MKIALMTLALVLCCSVCYAQVPTNPKRSDGVCAEPWCMAMQFKYTFCDASGNAVTKCSDDPNNEPGLKLLKRRIPINYSYDDWTLRPETTGGDDKVTFYEGDLLTGPIPYDLFIGANMNALIAQAAQRWMTGLCQPQGPDAEYQDCQVVIRWTILGERIGNVFALTDYDVVGGPGGCSVDCPTVQIILNQEDYFTDRDEFNRPVRFIATERMNYGHLPFRSPTTGQQYEYRDAHTVMVHEFGHWLGFQHTDEPDSYGNICGDPNSIMHGVMTNLQIKDLTPADECMFMKAYCCAQSQREINVAEDPRDPDDPPHDGTKTVIATPMTPNITGFTVLPNPSRSGELMVHLALSEDLGSGELRLVDAAGKVVLHQQCGSAKGEEVSLDVSGLSKGMYMVQVLFNGHAFSRKVIIE